MGEFVDEFELRARTISKGWIGAGARQPADFGTAGQIYGRSNTAGRSLSEAGIPRTRNDARAGLSWKWQDGRISNLLAETRNLLRARREERGD